jgi:hypothetical protein
MTQLRSLAVLDLRAAEHQDALVKSLSDLDLNLIHLRVAVAYYLWASRRCAFT